MKIRAALLAIMTLLFAVWYAPKISADRFRGPILQALETALGRHVEIGAVKFRLIPAPGFTVEDVRIGEDPAIGLEPVAYINTLRAVPRLSALLGGTMAFYSVDLEEASVNLTRVKDEKLGVLWNVSSLMRPALLQTFPSLHMSGGRLNFKLGETKSIFYLLNTDIDLWPPTSDRSAWTFRIRTEPARTDRPARGFGSFAGRGEWQQQTSSLTLDVKLAKSQLGELLTFFAGHDTGIRGQVSGEAHLAGPVTKVGVRARLSMADVHSWELASQAQMTWPVSVGGVIDVPGQTLDLRATGDNSPIDVRYRVASFLGRPRWGAMAYFAKLPIAPLLAISRNLGAAIPEDMKLSGTVEGAVGYSTVDGPPKLDGQIQIADTTIGVAGTPPLKMDLARLTFSGSTASLAPASVRNERDEAAIVTGSYDISAGQFELGVSSTGMEIASLRKQISLAGTPVLGQATSGVWSGSLRYRTGWTGDLHLENADIPFEAFAEPVHIVEADAALEGSDVTVKKLNLTMGGMQASGDYRYDAAAARPHKFRLTMPQADGAALEALLMPTLRRGNLFTYAFSFATAGNGRTPQPDWLRNMRADGLVSLGTLQLMDVPLDKVRARVVWDGTQVKFAGLQAALEKAVFAGIATVDLGQRKPSYRVAGHLSGMAWRAGVLDADGEIETSGLGSGLLTAMKAQGSFHGKGLDFSPFDVYSLADGCFDWAWDARNAKLRLTQFALTSNDGVFVGSGEAQEDGQMLLRLSDGTRQVQAAGAIWKGGGFRSVGQ